MISFKLNTFDSAKGVKEVGTLLVNKRENLGAAMKTHGYIKSDALIVGVKGKLTVVLSGGKKYLLDEI